jgi:hypothetical protein
MRWIVLNGQGKSTETDAGVLDREEGALLQVMFQHGEGSLEDGVYELDSCGVQTEGYE